MTPFTPQIMKDNGKVWCTRKGINKGFWLSAEVCLACQTNPYCKCRKDCPERVVYLEKRRRKRRNELPKSKEVEESDRVL